MRQGVIRPRQYGHQMRAKEDSKYAKYDETKSAKGRKALALAALVLAAVTLMYVLLFGGEGRGDSLSVSVNVEPGSGGKIRGSFDDEDDEDDEAEHAVQHKSAGDEDDDDDDDGSGEEEEGGEGRSKGRHSAEHDEDADEDGADEDAEEEDNGVHGEFEGGEDEEQHESAERGHVSDQLGGAPRFDSALLRGKPTLSIESYFLNLGKKSVNISPSGSFKFAIVHARDTAGDGAYIVQGCSYKSKTCKHPDAARVVRNSLESHGLEARVLGGGRVTRHHLRKSKKAGLISIFGYSRTFGRCADCNRITCELVAQAYPDYVVRWSNQGYNEGDEYGIKDFVKCSAP